MKSKLILLPLAFLFLLYSCVGKKKVINNLEINGCFLKYIPYTLKTSYGDSIVVKSSFNDTSYIIENGSYLNFSHRYENLTFYTTSETEILNLDINTALPKVTAIALINGIRHYSGDTIFGEFSNDIRLYTEVLNYNLGLQGQVLAYDGVAFGDKNILITGQNSISSNEILINGTYLLIINNLKSKLVNDVIFHDPFVLYLIE